MEKLKFSQNWNSKLDCQFFTTIRIQNKKYSCGNTFDIILNDQYLKTCKIVEIKNFKILQLNDFMSFIDAGMNKIDLYQLLSRFYPKQNINDLEWQFILLQTIIPAPSRQIEIQQEFKIHPNCKLFI
jgi:hypothetical protein